MIMAVGHCPRLGSSPVTTCNDIAFGRPADERVTAFGYSAATPQQGEELL
ncbi:hypothetical protein [Streptomyces sp. NPDC001508]